MRGADRLRDLIAASRKAVVFTGAGFPELARRHGARLVILNRDPTPLDPIAELVLNAEIGPALSAATASE